MYARSTTIVAQPSSIDAGITHVSDEVMPALQGLEGYAGLSLLADRSSGRCIATTAWQSSEAMRASVESVLPIRDRVAEILGGSAKVEEWEIAVLYRDHGSNAGASVRTTWVRVDPDRMDWVIDLYKRMVLAEVAKLRGFCGNSLLVNRGSGLTVSSSSFDSLEALEQNGDQLDRIRTAATTEGGAQVLDIGNFELAVARLGVPDIA